MELLDVVVGEGECTYNKIVDILLKESVSSKTTREWRRFARRLNVKKHHIQKLEQDMTQDKKLIDDVLIDVLTEWKSLRGKTATVENLVENLKKIEWNGVSDELSNAFQKKSAEPVSESQKLSDTIPQELSYYVPRRLLANNRISITDLTSATDFNDLNTVLVFIGISYDDLKLIVKDKIAGSGEMTRKWSNDTRYILLEEDEDWQKLCEKCKGSLHLVQINNGYLICLRSHGEINNFRKVIIAEGDQDEFSENEFLNVVNENETQELQLNIPICIADSPGMGKSVLLAELGRRLKEKCNDREVAYIVIPEYIESIKKSCEKIFEDRVKLALIDKLSNNKNLREKLKLDFNSNNGSTVTKYECLFDGFDEIQSDDFQFAYRCLRELVKCLRHCARLWATTRLHLLDELENCLGVCGYRIQPFNGTDKLNFLMNYWSPKDTKIRLKEFGERCLSAVESKLSDRERDILGIPLLCKLLAEVYETKARAFCGSNDTDEPDAKGQRPHFEINSITALYESFIANRIRKGFGINESNEDILGSYRKQIKRQKFLHVYLSMELIFPDAVNTVLSHYPIDELKRKKKGRKILRIGIVEAMSMKDEPRFLHRTIAEYFVAKFLVDSIPEKTGGEITRFFFETLSSDYYPNIRYFIDCLLKQNPQKYYMNVNIRFASLVGAGSLSGALESLIKSDLVNIFKLFHVAFGKELSHQPSVIKDWKHKAVANSSLEMINFIYEYYDDLPAMNKLKREDVSLLTVTIQNGDVDKFNCLLNNHGYYDILYRLKFTNLRECLKACLSHTASISEETRLQQRLNIFNKLMNIDPNNFRQTNVHSFCKTLEFREIHTKLLIELLRHGIGLVQRDNDSNLLYEEFFSRNDTLPLKCFLHAFAEGIWKTTVRLKISEQNMLIWYIENDISLHDLKEIPLLCILISELEERLEQMVDSSVHRKIPSQKRCKVVHIVTVYERLMQQLSRNNSLGNTRSNLENLQILLAFKFLAINLPREVELELTANLKDHEMYKLYKSQVAKLKQIHNSSMTVTNTDVVAQCLVVYYTKNTLSHNGCSHTVTFLFEAVLRVTSTQVETSGGTYFKEYKFVHQDLCRILDKLLSKRNEPTLASIVRVESYFYDILAASICQKFKNIFSLFLDKLKLTLPPMAEVSSHLEEASLETSAPLNCFQLINRISKLTLSEIKQKVFNFERFFLLVAMQEETIDYDMLKTMFAGGVDINSGDERGFTLLDYTVKEKRFDIANILLELGAKFGTEYYKGQNLLHTIVEHREKELFKRIMNLPLLNINEIDSDGNTALHVALMQSITREDLYDMVDELIGRGAQLDIKNKNGKTPISLAKERKDWLGGSVILKDLCRRQTLMNT